ncbi:hypothetical protein J8281_16770 [Aquimarina sp. U1-2]|uniref:hypothetical protein n=1 Tax=Aquimarina sp. U1-2 TaxID=2823141 RepID=UPI001AECA250|nr:hypothetical protein [Aquimarina sp. U1-2]MBP2833851.1 hypothetical protein [Aquimarina sp. U1-2]
MKQTIKLTFILAILVSTNCSPKITSNFSNPKPKLSIDEKVALLDIDHQLPDNSIKIGNLRFQDTGFSTDCSFNSIMNRARTLARNGGANLVKVVHKKKPDLWSTCYRLKIELYTYDGDVTLLPQQYQLQLD